MAIPIISLYFYLLDKLVNPEHPLRFSDIAFLQRLVYSAKIRCNERACPINIKTATSDLAAVYRQQIMLLLNL